LRPTLILHIGLERTGTTSLQRFCADHRRALRAASILYPTRGPVYAGGAWRNHIPLASCYFDDDLRDFSVPFPAERKASLLTALFREIGSSSADVTLLSSEHFSSRLRRPQVQTLAADLADYERRVGVMVRPHMSRFFSSYSTHVLAGGTTGLDAYADSVLSAESRYFRYAETIRPWEEAFGRQNVGIFVYERNGDCLRTMIDRFAPRTVNAPPLSVYGENISYGPQITEAFRRANIEATERRSWSNSPQDWARRRFVNFLMKMWLKTTTINLRAGVWTLGDERLSRLKNLAQVDRRWLSEERGVRMGDEVASIFGSDDPPAHWMDQFTRRADAFWLLTDAIQPVFALPLLTERTARLARAVVGLR
jgi:hypothetical protein